MKGIKKLIACIICTLLTVSSAFSVPPVFAAEEKTEIVDIVDNGALLFRTFGVPAYSYIKSSTGKYMITLDLKENKTKNIVTYDITFGEDPMGWLLNIGDSITNNGYGGDAGTQSNDSELQIIDGTMCIYCNDDGDSRLLISEPNCAPPNGRIKIQISNNTVSYYNYETQVSKTWSSPYIFALDGQIDSQGEADYKLYTGINRVIDGEYRLGDGVTKAHLSIGK